MRSEERLVCSLFIHQRSIDIQKHIVYAAVVAVDSSHIIQRICVLNLVKQRMGHTGNQIYNYINHFCSAASLQRIISSTFAIIYKLFYWNYTLIIYQMQHSDRKNLKLFICKGKAKRTASYPFYIPLNMYNGVEQSRFWCLTFFFQSL